MLITGIEEQVKHKDRVSVFIDGQFAFGMTKDAVLMYNITAGRDLSESEYKEILRNTAFDDAKRYAVKYLSYAKRTTKEIVKKLKEYEISGEIIKETVIYLRKHNYINDKEYTKNYVEDRLKRGYGAYRIKGELRLKGIKAEYIDAVIEKYDVDSVEAITAILKKRIKSGTKKGFYENERQKIFNYLKNRGFRYEDVKRAIEMYWDDEKEYGVQSKE